MTAVLSNPSGSITLPVTGLGTGTWMSFDDMASGKAVNSSSNSFNIPLQTLIDNGYPYLKGNIVDINNHKLTVIDTAGKMGGTFVVNESHPNTTLGLVICILGRKA